MSELVDWLRSLPPTQSVTVEPFLSSTTAVVAFYSPADMLGACVTIARGDPVRGGDSFARAMTT
jgi:hypothetical protein